MSTREQYNIETKDLQKLIKDICMNPDYMFNDCIRGDNEYDIDLIGVIVGMYEIIHRMKYDEPYDYYFHWANKCGSWVETDYLIELLDEWR